MRKLLLLEDDAYLAQATRDSLVDVGVFCTSFATVRAIEPRLKGDAPDALIVDLAAPLGASKLVTNHEARGGFQSGQAVVRYAKKRWPNTPMAIITGKPSEDVRRWCAANDVDYFLKPVATSTLERFLGVRKPRAFVVHGRNKRALAATKAGLRSVGVEPVVLMEVASLGRTVIEKFEEVADGCDCAVVVVSPDDIGNLVRDARAGCDSRFRARQNVLFELGYFCGSFGRQTGRVVLLEYGEVEIPSDLAGVVRLDAKVPTTVLRKALALELASVL